MPRFQHVNVQTIQTAVKILCQEADFFPSSKTLLSRQLLVSGWAGMIPFCFREAKLMQPTGASEKTSEKTIMNIEDHGGVYTVYICILLLSIIAIIL